ncbi:MAG: Hpt domain-containing protein [Pirellulaceae bacterium]|nr:Hpt domain-containing protein [Pirellulaceae bacterium]
MNDSIMNQTAIHSTFGGDPDLGEIVDMFVAEMPERVKALETSHAEQDKEQLGRLAHQLKGAAGSYGFDVLTNYAGRLEDSVRGNEPEAQVLSALEELLTLCNKVKPGAGGE